MEPDTDQQDMLDNAQIDAAPAADDGLQIARELAEATGERIVSVVRDGDLAVVFTLAPNGDEQVPDALMVRVDANSPPQAGSTIERLAEMFATARLHAAGTAPQQLAMQQPEAAIERLEHARALPILPPDTVARRARCAPGTIECFYGADRRIYDVVMWGGELYAAPHAQED